MIRLNPTYQNYYDQYSNFKEVVDYAVSIIEGTKVANKEQIQGCQRFLDDLNDERYELIPKDAEFCIKVIENTFVHIKGDIKGQPYLLETWQKYIIYNLAAIHKSGTDIKKYNETFIFLPRKNSKTFFASSLGWAFSLLEYKRGSNLYIVATKLARAKEAWSNILDNLEIMGEKDNFRVLDNNAEHSISRKFYDANGNVLGNIHIQALAQDAKKADGLNCNLLILDELHGFKNANEYFVYRQAQKAYTRKLLIGITTAGSNMNSFCYQRLQYCQKVLDKQAEDESYFIFIAKADETKAGVDYTNPIEWEKANPNWGVTIRESDFQTEAMQALNDPSARDEFLNKSLNIYTNTASAWFNMGEVQYSNEQYSWTMDELVKLPITWYGGGDLSVRWDLSAAVLYGRYEEKDVDIVISHGFIPITQAKNKAEQDNVPFFYWAEKGWLTLCNGDVVDHADVVKWFVEMQNKGFKIKNVAFDKYQSREFERMMKEKKFKMIPASQNYWMKSEAFREIEKRIKEKKFYYVNSKAYEYCISNVKGNTDHEDRVRFEKVHENQRIDLFDASVIACKTLLIEKDKKTKLKEWFD